MLSSDCSESRHLPGSMTTRIFSFQLRLPSTSLQRLSIAAAPSSCTASATSVVTFELERDKCEKMARCLTVALDLRQPFLSRVGATWQSHVLAVSLVLLARRVPAQTPVWQVARPAPTTASRMATDYQIPSFPRLHRSNINRRVVITIQFKFGAHRSPCAVMLLGVHFWGCTCLR